MKIKKIVDANEFLGDIAKGKNQRFEYLIKYVLFSSILINTFNCQLNYIQF